MAKELSLQHRIKEPSRPSVGRPPLMLLLHGLGGDETSLYFMSSKLDGRFFFASARAPYILEPGSYAWFHVAFDPAGNVIEPGEAEASRLALLGFIDELVQSYGLDAKRVYLLGFSQGAMMSLSAALTEPEKIAGVVAASGRILPEVLPRIAATERLRGLPIFVSHGVRDQIVPIRNGRAIRDRLSREPVELTYQEYDMAHEIRQECTSDIVEWVHARLGP